MAEPLRFTDAMAALPLVAILRGIRPDEAVATGETLVAEGFRLIEVPLNSPEPLDSIRRLAKALAGRAVVGAGTVLKPADVDAIADAGGTLIVMLHTDIQVIARAKSRGLIAVPGFAMPSEAFAKFAAEILYVNCGGPHPDDPRKVTFTKLRRAIWPLDEDAQGHVFQ
jgi:2-dehydro-3-deoxyphosphogalactonate aldolase